MGERGGGLHLENGPISNTHPVSDSSIVRIECAVLGNSRDENMFI